MRGTVAVTVVFVFLFFSSHKNNNYCVLCFDCERGGESLLCDEDRTAGGENIKYLVLDIII